MTEKFFRHCKIHTQDQDEVEREIQSIYNDESTRVLSMTVTPYRLKFNPFELPDGYDICYIYETRND